MSFFSILGKIIMVIVIFGIVIGGGIVYLYFMYVSPEITKLETIDKINYELERAGESKISMNVLTGGLSR